MPPPISPSLYDQFARGWRGYVLIALLALTASLFGAGRIAVMDTDEARFAQATRQMIESGDYLNIRVQDEARNRKLVGVHWLQAAAVQAAAPFTGKLNAIWPYRLPSALGIVLAAVATLWGGAALVGPRAAFFGAALLAVGLLVSFEGMTAKTDAPLLGFTTLMMAALARLRTTLPDLSAAASPLERGGIYALVFWFALACGVMIKGPVTPLVAVLSLTALWAWERRATWMKLLAWWPGPALALLIVAPWSIAIARETGGGFFTGMFGDIAPKLVSGDEGHFALPGYHVFLLPLLIFPGTYVLPAAARLSWETARAPRADEAHAAHRFLLCWAAPVFVFFELAPTKLAHYAMPAYPAIALLCGAGLLAVHGRRWRSVHPAGVTLFAVTGGVIVAFMALAATFMPGDAATDLRRAISAALVGVGIVAAAVTALIMLRRPAARAAALVACSLALSFSLRERILPEARELNVSGEVVAALTRARLTPTDTRALWVVGYSEPSFIFLTRTSVRLATPANAGAQAQLDEGMVIEGEVLEETAAQLALRNLMFLPSEAPVRGLALGRGEFVELSVGVVSPLTSDAPGAAPPRNP